MPILRICGGACCLVCDDLCEGSRSGGIPEADGTAGEVDVVCEVVPGIGSKSGAPLGHSANVPAESGVGGSGFSRDQTKLNFCEMALEATDAFVGQKL